MLWLDRLIIFLDNLIEKITKEDIEVIRVVGVEEAFQSHTKSPGSYVCIYMYICMYVCI